MYTTVIFLHGLLRWVIFASVFAAVFRAARAKEYTAADNRIGLLLTIAMDTQILLGLFLYFMLSPLTQAAFADVANAMKNHVLRFFLVEHIFAMVLALVAVHVGRVLIRRAPDDALKLRRARIWYGVALVAIVVGMPWPGLPYGRPLFPHM